jgi:hypothetical protein
MPWGAIKYVTSGMTLIAFITMLGVWLYREKLSQTGKLIRLAPISKRADIIDTFLNKIKIDTTMLTKQQRYFLAIKIIDERLIQYKTTAKVIISLAIITAGLAAYSIRHERPSPFHDLPKHFQTFYYYDDKDFFSEKRGTPITTPMKSDWALDDDGKLYEMHPSDQRVLFVFDRFVEISEIPINGAIFKRHGDGLEIIVPKYGNPLMKIYFKTKEGKWDELASMRNVV